MVAAWGFAEDRACAEQVTQIVTYTERMKIPLNEFEAVS